MRQAKRLLPSLQIDAQDAELPEDHALSWLPDFIELLR